MTPAPPRRSWPSRLPPGPFDSGAYPKLSRAPVHYHPPAAPELPALVEMLPVSDDHRDQWLSWLLGHPGGHGHLRHLPGPPGSARLQTLLQCSRRLRRAFVEAPSRERRSGSGCRERRAGNDGGGRFRRTWRSGRQWQEVSQHEEKLIELGGRSARERTGRIVHDAEGDRQRAATVRRARRASIDVIIYRDDIVGPPSTAMTRHGPAVFVFAAGRAVSRTQGSGTHLHVVTKR